MVERLIIGILVINAVLTLAVLAREAWVAIRRD